MQKEKLEEIKNMPKVVLHLHLYGSLRPETVYDWLKQGENNVTLEEFLKSSIADEQHIMEQYSPGNTIIESLKELCEKVLQPIREELGFQLTITSGYRCPRLNTLAKGSSTSDHMKGFAADIICQDNAKLFKTLKKYKFKQLIDEYNLNWVHVSYDKNNLKQEILYIK